MKVKQKPWAPSEPNSLECIQIVYKVVERCNINCSYCYYFNMGDKSALDRPARVTGSTTEMLSDWLIAGVKKLKIPNVSISFHGGEPMLLKPKVFSSICETLTTKLKDVANLSLSIQTNGTIMNEEWLRIFHKYQISVGVSIDGRRIDNDLFRLDHKGKSTFSKLENNIKYLVNSAKGDKSLLPSSISVMNHNIDYRKVYKYLRKLGLVQMHFLLPDRNGDDLDFRNSTNSRKIGKGLLDIFHSWMEENNPDIRVRFVDETLRHFQIGSAPGPIRRRRKDVQVLIVRSDGTVSVDDSYIPALKWYSKTPIYSIKKDSLQSVLLDPIFTFIEDQINLVPKECNSCRWYLTCQAGDLENRFKEKNGFDNPSIYCESYKILYSGVSQLLIQNGYPIEEVENRFNAQ